MTTMKRRNLKADAEKYKEIGIAMELRGNRLIADLCWTFMKVLLRKAKRH